MAGLTRFEFLFASGAMLSMGGRLDVIAASRNEAPPLTFSLFRPDELLAVDVSVSNAWLDGPWLRRLADGPIVVSITMPPQTFYEESYGGAPTDTPPLLYCGTPVVLSVVVDDVRQIRFTAADLLEQLGRKNLIADSRFEAPPRLFLKAVGEPVFLNHRSHPPPPNGKIGVRFGDPRAGMVSTITNTRRLGNDILQWTELWHTRLSTAAGNVWQDAREQDRPVRYVAVESRAVGPVGGSTIICDSTDDVCELSQQDRDCLIRLTPRYPVVAKPGSTAFSHLGAHLDLAFSQVDRASTKPDNTRCLSSWIYRTGLGRQAYQRRTYAGFLYPWGNKATLVLKSVRSFGLTPSGRRVAYLRCVKLIHVDEPRITLSQERAQACGFSEFTIADQDVLVKVRDTDPDLDAAKRTDCIRTYIAGFVPYDASTEREHIWSISGIPVGAKPTDKPVTLHNPTAVFLNLFVLDPDEWKTYGPLAAKAFSRARASEEDVRSKAVPRSAQQTYTRGDAVTINGTAFVCARSGKPAPTAVFPTDGTLNARGCTLVDGDVLWLRYPARNDILLHDQVLSLIAPTAGSDAKQLENGALETLSMTMDAGAQLYSAAVDSLKEVRPRLSFANVRVPALKEIVGQVATIRVALPKDAALDAAGAIIKDGGVPRPFTDADGNWKLNFGPANVFAEVQDTFTGLRKPLDVALLPLDGDAVRTGIVTYRQQLAGLSQTAGPIYGGVTSLAHALTKGTWSPTIAWPTPTSIDPNAALAQLTHLPKLFGFIDLSSIVEDVVGDLKIPDALQVPRTVKSLSADRKSVTYSYQHKTNVRNSSHDSFVKFVKTSDAAALEYEQKTTVALDPTANVTGSSLILALTNCGLDLGGILTVTWDELSLRYQSGQSTQVKIEKPNFAIGANNPLSFLQAITKLFDPSATGPIIKLSPTHLKAGYFFPIPNASFGAFLLRNIAMGVSISLPLSDRDDKGIVPASFSIDISRPERPFTLAIAFLGGGGSFGLDITTKGQITPHGSFEVGAYAGLDFFVASGFLRIAAGLAFGGSEGATIFSGYFHAEGSVTVLGILSADVTFHAGVTYLGGRALICEAVCQVSVSMMFFSASFSLHVSHAFDVGHGDAAQRNDAFGDADRYYSLKTNLNPSVPPLRVAAGPARLVGNELQSSVSLATAVVQPREYNGTQRPLGFRQAVGKNEWSAYCGAFA